MDVGRVVHPLYRMRTCRIQLQAELAQDLSCSISHSFDALKKLIKAGVDSECKLQSVHVYLNWEVEFRPENSCKGLELAGVLASLGPSSSLI